MIRREPELGVLNCRVIESLSHQKSIKRSDIGRALLPRSLPDFNETLNFKWNLRRCWLDSSRHFPQYKSIRNGLEGTKSEIYLEREPGLELQPPIVRAIGISSVAAADLVRLPEQRRIDVTDDGPRIQVIQQIARRYGQRNFGALAIDEGAAQAKIDHELARPSPVIPGNQFLARRGIRIE